MILRKLHINFLLGAMLCCSLSIMYGQNYVPNPSFENYTSCPTGLGSFTVTDWTYGDGTPDYFHECNGFFVGVPDNFRGSQVTKGGDAYAGLILFVDNGSVFREYLVATLLEPLLPGCYELSLWYSMSDNSGFSNNLGMALTEGSPADFGSIEPQLENQLITNNTDSWQKLSRIYTTFGGESHISIGNFRNNLETFFIPNAGSIQSYTYIDSVAVKYLGPLDFNFTVNLGPDIEVCTTDFPYWLESDQPTAINEWSTGETGPGIFINNPGTYYVTSNGGCKLAVDTIHITAVEPPELELEEEYILCEGETITIELDPDQGTYLWQDGSQASSYDITNGGWYSVFLDHPCGDENIYFEVIIHNEIVHDAIDDFKLCDSGPPKEISLIDLFDGTNEFLWSDGSSGPTFVIDTSGTFTLEVSNDCHVFRDTFTVDIDYQLPNNLGIVDSILCPGDSIVVDTALDGAALMWSDGSTILPYYITSPGSYFLSAENYCDTVEYSIEINDAPSAEINLGEDVIICPIDTLILANSGNEILIWNTGDTSSYLEVNSTGLYIAGFDNGCTIEYDSIYVDTNGTVPVATLADSIVLCFGETLQVSAFNTSGNVDVNWSDGQTGQSIDLDSGGTYIASGANSCGTTQDTIVVIEKLPLPDLVGDDLYELCVGDSIELDLQIDDSAILWSDGTEASSNSFSEEGTYWVSASNQCEILTDSFRVRLTALPEKPDLGTDQGLCFGSSLSVSSMNQTNNQYIWSTGDTISEIMVDQHGLYWLELFNECGNARDTIIIQDLGDVPSISTVSTVLICQGDTALLEPEILDAETVLWNTGDIVQEISVVDTGLYSLTASNICGESIDSILVDYLPPLPEIDLGEDAVICQGESLLLTTSISSGDILWSTGETTPEINISVPGLYSVNYQDACGEVEDSIYISQIPNIELPEIENNNIFCEGEEWTFAFDAQDGVDILWSTGDTLDDISIDTQGLYWLQLSNECFEAIDTFQVQMIDMIGPWSLIPDTLICDQNTFEISGINIPPDVSLSWSGGSEGPSLIVNNSGTYQLTVSTICESLSDAVEVRFMNSPPEFILEGPDSLCSNEEFRLEVDLGDDYDYLWQNGSTEKWFDVDKTDLYNLDVSNECGVSSASRYINYVEQIPTPIDIDDIYLLCEFDTLTIDLTPIPDVSLIWDDGSDSWIRNIDDGGLYSLELIQYCADSLVYFEVIEETCFIVDVYVPNIFSPNGDGDNDYFSVAFSDKVTIEDFEIVIYSRWGEEVYRSNDPMFQWNGEYKSRILGNGVYAFLLKAKVSYKDEESELFEYGDLTIFR